MPTFRHGKNTVVLSDEYSLSDYLNSVSHSNAVETPETTVFGLADRTYIVGHTDGSISFEGLFEGDTDAIDELLDAALGSDTERVITIGNEGGALGRRAVLLASKSQAYEISSPLTDVVSITGSAVANGGLDYGVFLASQAITTTLTGNAVDNAASSSNGGVGHLHITANANDGATVAKIQSSADNVSWADLVTFTTVTASTTASERIAITGSVPRYLRALVTPAGSGSLTVNIAFSRR
jgi:hypothetical protein